MVKTFEHRTKLFYADLKTHGPGEVHSGRYEAQSPKISIFVSICNPNQETNTETLLSFRCRRSGQMRTNIYQLSLVKPELIKRDKLRHVNEF